MNTSPKSVFFFQGLASCAVRAEHGRSCSNGIREDISGIEAARNVFIRSRVWPHLVHSTRIGAYYKSAKT